MGYGIYKNMYILKIHENYWIWQLVLDGVVDMDVGYKASDPRLQNSPVTRVQSITVEFFYFTLILHSKVGRNNLTSADIT